MDDEFAVPLFDDIAVHHIIAAMQVGFHLRQDVLAVKRIAGVHENNPSAFQIFFKNAGIDLEQAIKDEMSKFSQEFLGGENA